MIHRIRHALVCETPGLGIVSIASLVLRCSEGRVMLIEILIVLAIIALALFIWRSVAGRGV